VRFEIVGELEDVMTIASGTGVRIRAQLRKAHGVGHWRKMKGTASVRLANGQLRRVELHWNEAHGIGRRDFKIQALPRRVMPRPSRKSSKPFAVCVDNRGNEASLILGKVYRVRPDARAARDDLPRVVDESGEDYLFDAD
jgi:hypothetical protein